MSSDNEQLEDSSQITLKNAVVVGIQLNSLDRINSIDMNEISHQDPYVYTLSSSYGLQDLTLSSNKAFDRTSETNSQFNFHDSELGEQRPDADRTQRMKFSQFIEKQRPDRLGLFHSQIFYGVVLAKMQKQLVIRTPYVFNNKTLLTLEVVIRKTPEQSQSIYQSIKAQVFGGEMRNDPSEKQRFVLEPDQKFPIDSQFFYNYSIKVRVLNQNSVALEEGKISQQMSFRKNTLSSGALPHSSSGTVSAHASHTSGKTPLIHGVSNKMLFSGRKFSKDVAIESLIGLDLN